MNKVDTENYQESSILLWGDTHSGKSALISAFIKELELLSRSNKHNFVYRVRDAETNLPIISHTEQPKPTDQTQDRIILIERIVKKDSQKQDNYRLFRHFKHKITIRDIKGDDAKERRNNVKVSIDSFEHILAMVDVTTPRIKKQELIHYLKILCNTLSERDSKAKKNLAFCLTKIDRLSLRHNDEPETIFNDLFEITDETLSAYANLKINFFATSALGFLKQKSKSGNRRPNFSQKSAWLHDPKNWHPEKAHTPFFWIFTCIEKYQHEEQMKKLNPITRIFHFLIKNNRGNPPWIEINQP